MNICALAAYGNKGKIAKQPTKDCEGATDTSTKDQVIQTHTHTRATQHTHATRACLNNTPKLMHTCMQASGANIARETFEHSYMPDNGRMPGAALARHKKNRGRSTGLAIASPAVVQHALVPQTSRMDLIGTCLPPAIAAPRTRTVIMSWGPSSAISLKGIPNPPN